MTLHLPSFYFGAAIAISVPGIIGPPDNQFAFFVAGAGFALLAFILQRRGVSGDG